MARSATSAFSPSCTPCAASSRPRETSSTVASTPSRTTFTRWAISRVERLVFSARLRTSLATTAKALPLSPAWLAMMAALSASRLVWSAIS